MRHPALLPLRTVARMSLFALFAVLSVALARESHAQDEPGDRLRDPSLLDPRVVVKTLYAQQHEAIWAEALAERAELVERMRHARRGRRAAREHGHAPAELRSAPSALRPNTSDIVTAGLPPLPDVRVNDISADSAIAGQSETAIAADGDSVVASWNDGMGFYSSTADVQGISVSLDGGTTWQKGPAFPNPRGWSIVRWVGDPVVTVDTKRHHFYVAGLGLLSKALSGTVADSAALLVGRLTRGPSSWSWTNVSIPRFVDAHIAFPDKEWIAADSSNGNVYLVHTWFDYVNATNSIQFQRSTDLGTTWSTPKVISGVFEAGNVQGGRVACGPDGSVLAAYMFNDPTTGQHDVMAVRSTDGGFTFATEMLAAQFWPNVGTGAPGFNRTGGVGFPSLAIDRTNGPNRGRAYVAFAGAYNYGDDVWVTQPAANTVRFEAATNTNFANATSFSVGMTLRGTGNTGSNARPDHWVCSSRAGQNILVWYDSTLAAVNGYSTTIDVFASDTTHLLAHAVTNVKPGSFSGKLFTFTTPYQGLYYIRVGTGNGTGYRIRTQNGVRGTEAARDRRDPFVTWTDASVWSPPRLVSDGRVSSDEEHPEVAVGADGRPYVLYFDERDDALGSRTHMYLARSDDGGTTWLPNQRLSNVASDFTLCPTNIVPNMGDYIALNPGRRRMHALWGDARGSSVDSYSGGFATDLTLTSCASDTAMSPLGVRHVTTTIVNADAYFAEPVHASWSDELGWIAPSAADVTLPAAAAQGFAVTLTVPANAAPAAVDHVCLTATNGTGTVVRQCCFAVTVTNANVAVGDAPARFELARSEPNPALGRARLRYSLAHAGLASLVLYDVAGARVRTLVSGVQSAGAHDLEWDGRDDAGAPVRAGMYFYRLEANGRRSQQRMVFMR